MGVNFCEAVMKVLIICVCLTSLGLATITELGGRCGSKKNGIQPWVECGNGLSCQQWVTSKGSLGAWYCMVEDCLGEGDTTSQDQVRLGVCCAGLKRQRRTCVSNP